MIRAISYPLSFFSAAGLFFGAVIHAAACLGILPWPFSIVLKFSFGVMIAVVPAILISNWLTRDYPRKQQWKAVFLGCPNWMRKTTQVLGFYAIANFALFAILDSQGKGGGNSLAETRFFTSYWLAFYAYSFSVSWSAIHWPEPPKCPQGHSVYPAAIFCDKCGAAVIRTAGDVSR